MAALFSCRRYATLGRLLEHAPIRVLSAVVGMHRRLGPSPEVRALSNADWM